VSSRYQLEYEAVSVSVQEEARVQKRSIEHMARQQRYQALNAALEKHAADYIAVAHTADDQVEEVLHRFLRGSSRKAVSGMSMKSGNIIRPLLASTKADLLNYLHEKHYLYCHDSSNDDRIFMRNRIRNELLPLLEKEYNSGIRKALLKTAANLGEDEALLHSLVDDAWKTLVGQGREKENADTVEIDRHLFSGLHSAIQRRLVERLLWEMGVPARYEHIVATLEAARANSSGTELHLSRGLRVLITRDIVSFSFPQGRRAWRGSIKNCAAPL